MTALELLSTLRRLGVEIKVEEDKLHLNAPKGVISAELKEEIAARKQEILAFLRSAAISEQTTEVRIPVYPRTGTVPLSYSQERLWFLEQLNPGNYAYNMPGAVRLKGFLNLDCFEQALNEILTRHEVLRTNFSTSNDQPIQIIQPARTLPLAMVDLSMLPSDKQLIEAKCLTEAEAKRPFDLTKDLLVRATLLKLSENDHIFLLTIHHIVTDGWSRGIFTREFIALYEAFAAGLPSPLSPLPIQYADFAQWQREWLQGERLDIQLSYWRQQLAGDLPELDPLLDKPRPPVQSLNSGKTTFQFPIFLAQSLRRLSQEEDATLFMTLLAAFKLLLYRYTGVEDIIVGSPIAGRNHAELENLIGFFINTLVLRTDLSGNPSFRELIRRVKKTALDAYTHQDIPFEKLLIELHPKRNLNRTPFFQVFFNMLNLADGRTEIPGLSAEVFDIPDVGSKFDLTLYVMEKDQSIDLLLVYNTDLFTPERIAEILQQYHDLLAQIVEHAGMKLDAYSVAIRGKDTRGNRAALPRPSVSRRGLEQEQVNARNDTEKELIRIWQDLLHIRKIGVKDNFFELGGHSLMAVHMFTRITEKFNVNLPLSTLFQEATIEHLARVIHRSAEPVAWSSLIEIEPAGDHPPFFCIHGITGDILWFRDLAKALAPDYPFYGLQARGLDGIQEPFSQVEDMAAFYIEEMRLHQPQGPYFLGGASLGGTVALEIAQQLVWQGEKVALLAIFDHFPRNVEVKSTNGKFTEGFVRAAKVARNFPNWFKEFMQLDRQQMSMRIRRKLRIARKLREQSDVPDAERFDAEDLIDFAPELSEHRHRVITSHYQAMNAYQPSPYPGRVTLFRAKSRPLLNTNDPEVVWQKLAPGNTRVIDIPGSHEGMFKTPQVNYMAEKLRNCIDQALENNSQQSVR